MIGAGDGSFDRNVLGDVEGVLLSVFASGLVFTHSTTRSFSRPAPSMMAAIPIVFFETSGEEVERIKF